MMIMGIVVVVEVMMVFRRSSLAKKLWIWEVRILKMEGLRRLRWFLFN